MEKNSTVPEKFVQYNNKSRFVSNGQKERYVWGHIDCVKEKGTVSFNICSQI